MYLTCEIYSIKVWNGLHFLIQIHNGISHQGKYIQKYLHILESNMAAIVEI